MTYNTDLMLQVRNAIRMEPERHNQDEWGSHPEADPSECGTTYCIAGWAVVLATGKSLKEGCAKYDETPGFSDVVAAQLLGLDSDEANEIFFCLDNKLALERFDALIEKAKNQ